MMVIRWVWKLFSDEVELEGQSTKCKTVAIPKEAWTRGPRTKTDPDMDQGQYNKEISERFGPNGIPSSDNIQYPKWNF